MTDWTPINSKSGKQKRQTPAVYRGQGQSQAAQIIFPEKLHGGAVGVDVFTDGNGRIAFRLNNGGSRKVWARSANASDRVATIPAEFRDRIPFGLTDVHLDRDGDMLVLDLSQFDRSDK